MPTSSSSDLSPHGQPAAPPPELIERYLAGECAPAEAVRVRAWIARDSRRALTTAGVKTLDDTQPDSAPLTDETLDAVWHRVRERALSSASTAPNTSRPHVAVPSYIVRPSWMRRALVPAALAVGATAIALVMTSRSPRSTSDTISVASYHTTPGQRATITLPGGSRATLGPSSRIDVTNDARRGITVAVDGQALFAVAHDIRAPFTVRAGASTTRVLGTTFFVRKYSTDVVARVAVVEGRVSVQGSVQGQSTDTPTVLSAGTLAAVTDSGTVHITPNIASDEFTQWTSGELVFKEAAVRDIAADLGRAYGVRIQLTDSTLAAQRLTWHIQTEQYPLSQALHELLTVLGAHVMRRDSIITIVPGRDTSRRSAPLRAPLTSESKYGR